MDKARVSELVFEVTKEAEGGYSAECLTEDIFTQGDTWMDLRTNAKKSVRAYFHGTSLPEWIRLYLRHDEILELG